MGAPVTVPAVLAEDRLPYTVEVYSSREEWKTKARPTFVGASEAAAVFGVSPFASPLSVFADKLGVAEDTPSSPIMELGNALEPHIAERYVAATGHELRDLGKWTVLRSRSHPFIACTLDREILDPSRPNEPGDLEMKAPLYLTDWEDGAPLHYQVQGMQQLFVTGWTWGVLAALSRSSGELVRYPFERHEAFMGELVERLAEFWARVQRGEAPSSDASLATSAALQAFYPKNKGGEVVLPGDFDEWDVKR